MIPMFEFLLLDLDDTILDFHQSEYVAIRRTLPVYGITPTDELCDLYSRINLAHWKALERKEITREELMVNRFAQLFEQLGEYRDIGITAYRCHLGELILNNIVKNMAVSFPPRDDSNEERYRHLYLAGAFYNVFIEWLKAGKPETVDEMARICCTLACDGCHISLRKEPEANE